jgi:hypothetical protein
MRRRFRMKDIIIAVSLMAIISFIEIIFRVFECKLSGDILQIHEIPNTSKSFADSKYSKILFVGNSLIGEAVDASLMTSILNNKITKKIKIAKAVPDGSDLPEWYFLIKNNFIKKNCIPDIIIIGFAWNNAFSDKNGVDHVRLAGSYCNISDIAEISDMGMKGSEKYLEFLLSKLSSVYVNKQDIRNRSLDLIIPYYRNFTQLTNRITSKNTKSNFDEKFDRTENIEKYQNLERLINSLANHSVKLILIAMPVVSEYKIDPLLRSKINKDISFLDFRNLDVIKENMFVDPIHLGEKGRVAFTRALADSLVPVLNALNQ